MADLRGGSAGSLRDLCGILTGSLRDLRGILAGLAGLWRDRTGFSRDFHGIVGAI